MRVVINWVQFANGMPRFQEQSTRPQATAVYDLDIIKIKFVVVFHTVLRQKRVQHVVDALKPMVTRTNS